MVPFITVPIRKLLNSLGYEIVKRESILSPFSIHKWITKLDIKTIIDVGANEGQFINSINRILPGKKIFAFEPIKVCYDKLVSNTKHLNVTAFNCGLSDHSGKSEINISENFVSSSILPIENLTTSLYPESHYVNKQTIELKRLDDVLAGVDIATNILLKIDVQGYEQKVIAGSVNILKNIAVLIIEFSYQPLYADQWLFDDTYKYFTSIGFKFVGIADQVNSKTSGVPIYGDAIFVNNELAKGIY